METSFGKWVSLQELFWLVVAFAALYVVAELLYHLGKINVEYTRKFVHISTGIITLFFPFLLNPLDLFIVCMAFGIFLVISKKLSFFQSVNGIERSSQGSILFPAAIVLVYFFQFYLGSYLYFLIPILILTVADSIAAMLGGKFPIIKYSILGNNKSIGGSLGFMITSILITIIGVGIFNSNLESPVILCALCIGLITTLAEAISQRGFDNLFVPLTTVFILWLFNI